MLICGGNVARIRAPKASHNKRLDRGLVIFYLNPLEVGPCCLVVRTIDRAERATQAACHDIAD